MNINRWTESELKALKFFYPNCDLKSACKEINKVNPLIHREVDSITKKASKQGLKSYKYKLKQQKISEAKERIKNGEEDFKLIAKETKLHYDTIMKINTRLNYCVDEKNTKKDSKPGEILDWEKYYLNNPTPEGFECPKLHTKRLNTYL